GHRGGAQVRRERAGDRLVAGVHGAAAGGDLLPDLGAAGAAADGGVVHARLARVRGHADGAGGRRGAVGADGVGGRAGRGLRGGDAGGVRLGSPVRTTSREVVPVRGLTGLLSGAWRSLRTAAPGQVPSPPTV